MAEVSSIKKSQSTARLLGCFVELGLEVDVLTAKYFHETLKEDSLIKAKYVNTYFGKENLAGRFLNSVIFSFKTIMACRKYDTVIFNQPNPLSNLGAFFAKKNTKIILEIRDIWPDALQDLRSRSNLLIYFEKLITFLNIQLFKRADGIITALAYWEKANIPLLHMPTLTSTSSPTKSRKVNSRIKIAYFGGYKYQSNVKAIIELLVQSSSSSILRDVEFHFFGGVNCGELCELKKIDSRIFLYKIIEYEKFSEISKTFYIGLLAFHDWDVYKYGLNSNRLSAYLENGITPYAICNHSFEPEIDKIITKVKNGLVDEQVALLESLVLNCMKDSQTKKLREMKYARSQKRHSPKLGKFLSEILSK